MGLLMKGLGISVLDIGIIAILNKTTLIVKLKLTGVQKLNLSKFAFNWLKSTIV